MGPIFFESMSRAAACVSRTVKLACRLMQLMMQNVKFAVLAFKGCMGLTWLIHVNLVLGFLRGLIVLGFRVGAFGLVRSTVY